MVVFIDKPTTINPPSVYPGRGLKQDLGFQQLPTNFLVRKGDANDTAAQKRGEGNCHNENTVDIVGNTDWRGRHVDMVTERLLELSLDTGQRTTLTGGDASTGRFRIFAYENHARWCHWSVGFLWDFPFTSSLHSGITPFPPHFTLNSSQYFDQELSMQHVGLDDRRKHAEATLAIMSCSLRGGDDSLRRFPSPPHCLPQKWSGQVNVEHCRNVSAGFPKKVCLPATESGTIPMCENLGVTPLGIEPVKFEMSHAHYQLRAHGEVINRAVSHLTVYGENGGGGGCERMTSPRRYLLATPCTCGKCLSFKTSLGCHHAHFKPCKPKRRQVALVYIYGRRKHPNSNECKKKFTENDQNLI
ncbi:hypothetical protein PR048_004724 [Dryococelus australis]|uniref:Uncharacterized protein n=1 Tax=Dryococelus australis TaxID=614101 RepID=A0ABQ9I659_9NEOP|nr:hypothetical protein PR048_004724 [Dryococelus australis]